MVLLLLYHMDFMAIHSIFELRLLMKAELKMFKVTSTQEMGWLCTQSYVRKSFYMSCCEWKFANTMTMLTMAKLR